MRTPQFIIKKGLRRCYSCKKYKPKEKFYCNKAHFSGFSTRCKKCENLRSKNRKEYFKRFGKKYRKKYPEKIRQLHKKYVKERRKTDSKFRLNCNMRRIIWLVLRDKKNGRKWESLVGYTIEDLMKHLENQFDKNMNWDNYGNYWWIDHKRPISLFHYIYPEDSEFRQCWALSNLQPLEKIANIKKGNRF